MIHCRADSDSRWHLVVQQPANLWRQFKGNSIVRIFFATVLRGVNTTGQVAFQVLEHVTDLRHIVSNHNQRRIPKGFRLESFRIAQKRSRIGLQQRVWLRTRPVSLWPPPVNS